MSISKLVIKAYSDESFATEKGEFSASINPANLKIASSVEYEKSQGMGSPSMALRYNVSPPKELSFKLLFDNTGIFPDSDTSVKDQLDALQDLVYKFQENTNSPYYVRVIWGIIDFKGKLVSLETNYTMFKSDGAPIRAEVDIVVLEDASSSKITQAIKAAANTTSTATTSAVAAGSAATAAGNNSATTASTNTAAANEEETTSSTTADTNEGVSADDTTTTATTASAAAASEAAAAAGGAAAGGAAAAAGGAAAGGAAASAASTADESTNAATPTTVKQTQASDTLPAVSKSSLGDPNLAKSLGSVNGLDSLRNLASGISLAVPLTSLGLLAMLLAMAKKYGSKGATYLKSKAKSGKEKAVAVKDKVKTKL